MSFIDFEQLLDDWPEGIVIIDEQGITLAVNRTAELILGYSAEQLLQNRFSDWVKMPDNGLREEAVYGSIDILLGTLGERLAQWWLGASGEAIDIEAIAYRISVASDPSTLIVFGESIDPELSPFFLRKLAAFPNIIPQPLAQVSAQGQIEFANEALNDLMLEHGFNERGEAVVFPEAWQSIAERAWQQERAVIGVEVDVKGQIYHWNFHPVLDQALPFVLVLGQDMTERLAYQRSLESINRLMAQTNKQKKRFIQSQNEQMVTPLTELTTSIELLRNSGLNAQQSGWLDHMYHAAQALNGLVQFSEDRLRIENHDLKLRAKAFNPRLLLVQQMDMFAPRIIAKALNYYLMIDPEVTPEMNGDAKRLSHVLRVLIENAITHTERGVIVVRLQRVAMGKRCVIRYSVTDTGEGLSEGKQKTLFTLAFNEGSSLHLARVIIRAMGGELTFRSQAGRGSTFVIELPSPVEPAAKEIIESHYKVAFDLHDPMRRKSLHDLLQHANINLVPVEESDFCISDSSVPPGPNLNYYLGPHFRQNAGWTGEIPRHFRPSWFYQLLTGNSKEGSVASSIESLAESHYDPLNIRVLLIDDNHNDRLLTKTVLEGFGCEIIDLDNGDDALGEWFLSGGTLNLVLVDCKMPGTDGYQTTEQLRQENCNVPIIGLTERRYSEEIDDAIRAGMTTCITKPVDHDELYHIILDCF